MLGYIKLKTTNQELYETNYLAKLKEQNSKIAKLKYFICYWYYELIVWIKYMANIITIKQIYHAYIIILPFSIEQIRKTDSPQVQVPSKNARTKENQFCDT